MELKQAIERIAGRPDLFAWRPTGELVRMTNKMAIQDIRTGTKRPFSIKCSDILTDDWIVGPIEVLQKYSAEHWNTAPAAPPEA
jgi:hypothetical protein